MERFAQFRPAVRQLAKSPGFALAVVTTLGLGIGANAAVFSVFHSVLLAPLPFADADRLYVVWEDATYQGFPENSPAPANFLDWREQATSFQDMTAASTETSTLTGSGEPEQVETAAVTANFFDVLGSAPRLRRAFRRGEDEPGAPRVAVLGEALWQRHFHADPAVLGRDVILNGAKVTVVGIAPDLRLPFQAELWTPLEWTSKERANREDHFLTVLGRLRPEASEAQASAELATIAGRLQQLHPDTNSRLGTFAVPLRRQLVGDVRPALRLLMGGVGFVLLIACANVTHLMMARYAGRRRDLAVRIALGASRADLAALLLAESLTLALMAGALGLLLGHVAIALAAGHLPETLSLARGSEISVSVVAFTLVVSLAAGALLGIVPSLWLTRLQATDDLGRSHRGLALSYPGLRRVLVVGEVGLCLCLLIGAGLLVRSFSRLTAIPLGFEVDGVLTAQTTLPEHRYQGQPARQQFYARVLERVRALPGVVAAGYTSHLPLTWTGDNNSVLIEGQPVPPPSHEHIVSTRVVTPGFFRSLGVALLSGRDFDERDVPEGERAVIVNQALANQLFPEGQALGRRIHRGTADAPRRWLRVVGVVGDVRQWGVDVPPHPEIYLPSAQFSGFYFVPRDLTIRVVGDPGALAGVVRRIIHEVDPEQPISRLATLRQVVASTLEPRRFQASLFSAFGLIAMTLAAVGIYGVLSYSMTQRTREMAIRLALGALPRQVMVMVVGEGMRQVAAGLALGLGGAFALSRALEGLLFGVSATDPLTLGSVSMLLAIVALAACWLPARRVIRVDPAIALRVE
jgi:putative ABC transport system permease protein